MIDKMLEIAKRRAPVEACGLVIDYGVAGVEVLEANNLARDPENHFVIDPLVWAVEDQAPVIAIWHSHPGRRPDPSQGDRVACEATGLPWFIVAPERGDWTRIEPSGYEAPLEGREYSYGVLDCYTLIRDFYAREFGIELPRFDPYPEGWWEAGEDRFRELASNAGFVTVFHGTFMELRRGDVFLFQFRAPVPGHLAVYVGDRRILHHLAGRPSRIEEYAPYWQRHMVEVLRHQELLH